MARPRTRRTYQNKPELANLTISERLLFCARNLFQEKGFDGVNIRDLMSEADVTQSVIYYHYKNKDGLFLAVALDIVEEIDEFFKQALEEPFFDQQLRLIIRAFTQPPAPNVPLLIHDIVARTKLNQNSPNEGLSQQQAFKVLMYVNHTWPRNIENMLLNARKTSQIAVSNPSFYSNYILTLISAWSFSPFISSYSNNINSFIPTLSDFLLSILRNPNGSFQI